MKVKTACLRISGLFCISQSQNFCCLPSTHRWKCLQSTWISPTLEELLVRVGNPPRKVEFCLFCLSFSHIHFFTHSRHSRNISWLSKHTTKAWEEIYWQKKVKNNTTGPSFVEDRGFVWLLLSGRGERRWISYPNWAPKCSFVLPSWEVIHTYSYTAWILI